jgi:hypothetical protein
LVWRSLGGSTVGTFVGELPLRNRWKRFLLGSHTVHSAEANGICTIPNASRIMSF